ncbi:unnamed protein product [Adineta ricciae]|uniref:Ig-like domain-containing protein n=1 Tax=Adineta ricciae TaxID=249248 RepID=A0A813N1N1_ADIRI|nr:unnamed protein product [Adineta ricciae]CAF1580854.1 unnamed protein product [Adineta ricciae]
MLCQLLLISSISLLFRLTYAYRICSKESNPTNYLFLNISSQLKIPLIPINCFQCQIAHQIDIQLIDEQQFLGNRTIQRMKILLKNFEIEDTSYICLIKTCPIIVEYGSDSILLNITSPLFSHVFLSMIYLKDDSQSILCSIYTRFALIPSNSPLTCTEKIHLHPRKMSLIFAQISIYDCRADTFKNNIYQNSIQFQHTNIPVPNQTNTMKTSENPCEYFFQNIASLPNMTSIQTDELLTKVTIYPLLNSWNRDLQTFDACRTKLIPYREMSFTDDIIGIRNIYIEPGETIQMRCPIDGSEEYLKYTWYYQRYRPKYEISHNRTIVFTNITEQIQGKYMCIGDDGNEVLEFEMMLHVLQVNRTNTIYLHPIIIMFFITLLILFGVIISVIVCYSLKQRCSPSRTCNYPINKCKSLTVHHDVTVTIQQSFDQQKINSFWNQMPYYTFDYIDHQPVYSSPSTDTSSWIETSNSDLRQEQIAHRFSTRQRNVNGQPPTQLAIQLSSNSEITQIPLAKSTQISDSFHESTIDQSDDVQILHISVPFLNYHPTVQSSSSIISFDSQIEVDQFNRMTSLCMDNEALLADKQ